MKKVLIFICCIVSLGTLAGCSDNSDDIKTNTNGKVDTGDIDAGVKVDAGNIKTDIEVK